MNKVLLKASMYIVGFALAFHIALMLHLTYGKLNHLEQLIHFKIEQDTFKQQEDF